MGIVTQQLSQKESERNRRDSNHQHSLAVISHPPGKVNFCTGTGRKAFFRIIFGLILNPPRYICFYSEKRQIHLYRPFFPHCMAFLEKRGDWYRYTFLFSLPPPPKKKTQGPVEGGGCRKCPARGQFRPPRILAMTSSSSKGIEKQCTSPVTDPSVCNPSTAYVCDSGSKVTRLSRWFGFISCNITKVCGKPAGRRSPVCVGVGEACGTGSQLVWRMAFLMRAFSWHDVFSLRSWPSAPEIASHPPSHSSLCRRQTYRPVHPQLEHVMLLGDLHNSETGGIRFRRVRFQTPNSVSFSGLTEFRGANSVSSSQPIICV